MNISARCEYACRAVVELAGVAAPATPLTATLIAERRSIPEKYLVHILLQLKRAGIVRSVRGAQGGYLLANSPENITLLDIAKSVDGPVLEPLPVDETECEDIRLAWGAAATGISEVLDGITIKSIVDKASKADMYFI